MSAGQVVSCPLICMSGSDIHDDTTDDHERFERELLAQDRDARRVSTAGLDDETAQEVVRDLLDAGTVTPVVNQRVLVHEPSRRSSGVRSVRRRLARTPAPHTLGERTNGSVTPSVSTVRRRQPRTQRNAITTRVTAADSSSTRSPHSRASASNSATSKGRYSCASGVAQVAWRRTGRATSKRTSSQRRWSDFFPHRSIR